MAPRVNKSLLSMERMMPQAFTTGARISSRLFGTGGDDGAQQIGRVFHTGEVRVLLAAAVVHPARLVVLAVLHQQLERGCSGGRAGDGRTQDGGRELTPVHRD